MDSMYDFQIFEHGIHDTNQKLQYYRNFISFLLGELRTLQTAMCTSCREKCGSSPATGSTSQSFSTPNDLSLELYPLKRRHIEDDTPTMPPIAETDTFCRTPQASGLSSPPINETTTANSVVEVSTEPRTESDDPTFYAQKDDLYTTLDVGFVHCVRHEKQYVSSLSFSRDESYLAVAIAEVDRADQGSIVIYDVENRAKYCELREHVSQYGSYKRPRIWHLCFSANRRYLAAVDIKSRVIIWDLRNTRIRSIFQGCDSYNLIEVRFSPNGRLVAFCNSIELVVLNVRDNSRKMAYGCYCFDFSPNGKHIAAGNEDSDLAILDVRTGEAVKKWNGHGTHVFRVKFTSDGQGLLCLYNEVAEHWDLNEAEPILIRKTDTNNYLYRHAISPDNRLLSHSFDLRDVNTGKRQWILIGHKRLIYSADFSAAGTYFAIGDWDGVVSLWKYAWT